jgi:CRISPR system Cascade subunit CasB
MTVQRPELRNAASRWWRRTIDESKPVADPRVRALLRRAHTANEAIMIPAAVDLARRLKLVPDSSVDPTGRDLTRALDLTRVLAHIRTHAKMHPMRELGYSSFPGDDVEGGKAPTLSELRFRRLLQASAGEPKVAAFKRLVAQLDDTANVADIAEAFWFWNDPDAHVKQVWAFKYFNAGNDADLPASITDDRFHAASTDSTGTTATDTIDEDNL